MKFVKKTFLLALELELFTFKTKERCSTCERYEHYAYECSSVKCSKCGEYEHYDYECPSMSQHTNDVQIDNIDNSRIIEDVHSPSEVTSNVDDLIESNTLTLNEIHVNEENISDVQDALVESSSPICYDIDVSEDNTSDLEHVLVESSMPVQIARYSLVIPMIEIGIEHETDDTSINTSSNPSEFSRANCDYVIAPTFFYSSE